MPRAFRWARTCRIGKGAPRFLVWALKDPNSGNLDRIQIVKLWVEERREPREGL